MKRIISIIVMALFLANSVFAQTLAETSLSFRKMQAKTRAGINLRDYNVALQDLEFSTSEYERAATPKDEANAKSFRTAMSLYQKAAFVWEIYIKYSDPSNDDASFRDNVVDKDCPGAEISFHNNLTPCLAYIWANAATEVAGVKEVGADQNKGAKRPQHRRQ